MTYLGCDSMGMPWCTTSRILATGKVVYRYSLVILRWLELVHSGGRPVWTLVDDAGEPDALGMMSRGGDCCWWFMLFRCLPGHTRASLLALRDVTRLSVVGWLVVAAIVLRPERAAGRGSFDGPGTGFWSGNKKSNGKRRQEIEGWTGRK